MDPFLQTITTFPTVPLTVILGVVVGYWIFALVTGAAFHGGGDIDAVAGGVKAAGDATTGAPQVIASRTGNQNPSAKEG